MGWKPTLRNIAAVAGAPMSFGATLALAKDTEGNLGLDYITGAKSAREMERRQKQYTDEANALSIELANTAHQREVADLDKAGLNRVLSAGGTGAMTPAIQASTAQNENEGGYAVTAATLGSAAKTFSEAKLNTTQKQLAPATARAQNNLANAQAQLAQDQHEFYEETGTFPGAFDSESTTSSWGGGLKGGKNKLLNAGIDFNHNKGTSTSKAVRNPKKANSARQNHY